MILLITPPKPPGLNPWNAHRPIRVLYSDPDSHAEMERLKLDQGPIDLRTYDPVWPWTDLGGARNYTFEGEQWRVDLRFAALPLWLEVGKKIWLATLTGSKGYGEKSIDGCHTVKSISPRSLELVS